MILYSIIILIMEIEPNNVLYVGETLFNFTINKEFCHGFLCDIEINGRKYCSVEQYLIYKKAELFNDTDAMETILKTTDEDELHFIGRKIKNYDDKKWSEIREKISYEGNKAKFMNNSELYKKLFYTGFTKLIYYSFDDIWGCGNSRQGKNLLGNILMKIRENDMNLINQYNDLL